jgi:transposase-like protein
MSAMLLRCSLSLGAGAPQAAPNDAKQHPPPAPILFFANAGEMAWRGSSSGRCRHQVRGRRSIAGLLRTAVRALAAVWEGVPVQRCTVHKHRNPLAQAPERLHEEVTADYTDMIYAAKPKEIETRRKAFIRKWRLRHRPVADCLEEAGDRLFNFTRLPPSQWRSARTTNAIERLHEEFKRRIKTQTVLPSADTAAMLFWALLASGQINMRKVDGWHTLATKPIDQPIDLAA